MQKCFLTPGSLGRNLGESDFQLDCDYRELKVEPTCGDIANQYIQLLS